MKTARKTAYTPGPWEVESDGSTVAIGGECCILHPSRDDAPREEEKANARLIAAAPETFELLQRIIRRATAPNSDGAIDWDDVNAARAIFDRVNA